MWKPQVGRGSTARIVNLYRQMHASISRFRLCEDVSSYFALCNLFRSLLGIVCIQQVLGRVRQISTTGNESLSCTGPPERGTEYQIA